VEQSFHSQERQSLVATFAFVESLIVSLSLSKGKWIAIVACTVALEPLLCSFSQVLE